MSGPDEHVIVKHVGAQVWRRFFPQQWLRQLDALICYSNRRRARMWAGSPTVFKSLMAGGWWLVACGVGRGPVDQWTSG